MVDAHPWLKSTMTTIGLSSSKRAKHTAIVIGWLTSSVSNGSTGYSPVEGLEGLEGQFNRQPLKMRTFFPAILPRVRRNDPQNPQNPHRAIRSAGAAGATVPIHPPWADACPLAEYRSLRQASGHKQARAPAGTATRDGANPRRHSHLDCRSPLTLIVARQPGGACRNG